MRARERCSLRSARQTMARVLLDQCQALLMRGRGIDHCSYHAAPLVVRRAGARQSYPPGKTVRSLADVPVDELFEAAIIDFAILEGCDQGNRQARKHFAFGGHGGLAFSKPGNSLGRPWLAPDLRHRNSRVCCDVSPACANLSSGGRLLNFYLYRPAFRIR